MSNHDASALSRLDANADRELVTLANDQATTTSLVVAERFGKRHDNVIRDIRRLIEDCQDPEFTLLNFEECFRINALANGKKEPYYRIGRDGFVILAMGFTGDEALRWKIGFIKAFNAMEQALREVPPLTQVLPSPEAFGDAAFLTFLEITRGRIHRNADGSTHNTVSVNTAKLLHWLWQQPRCGEWMSANRSRIGRELAMDHTCVRRAFRRLESWAFLIERRTRLVVEYRLNREVIEQEIRTANPASAPLMIPSRIQ